MPETNTNFTPDVFDNTYLNTELEIPRYGDGPDFAKVMKFLRDKNGLKMAEPTIIQSWIQACMRESKKTDTKIRWQPIQ